MAEPGAPGVDIAQLGDRLPGTFNPHGGAQFAGPDKASWVVFYKGSRHNEFESKAQGKPIFDAVDFIKVHHPGEPSNIYNQPVRPDIDPYMWPKEWDAYKRGKTDDTSGTPLSVLFPANPELVDHLKALHIRTVQQLAGLSDSALQGVQFGRELMNKAKAYLDISEKGKEFHEVNLKIEQQAAQIADLTRALSDRGLAAMPPAAPADPTGASQALAAANAEIMALKAKLSRAGTRKKPKVEAANVGADTSAV